MVGECFFVWNEDVVKCDFVVRDKLMDIIVVFVMDIGDYGVFEFFIGEVDIVFYCEFDIVC